MHQLMDRLLINNNYYCSVQTSWTVENRASELELLYWQPSPSHPCLATGFMPPLFRVPRCRGETSFLPTPHSPRTFFQGRKDNVFLALRMNLTGTFVPVHAPHISATFSPYTAKKPVSHSSIFLLFSQYLPLESDKVHVRIENTSVNNTAGEFIWTGQNALQIASMQLAVLYNVTLRLPGYW